MSWRYGAPVPGLLLVVTGCGSAAAAVGGPPAVVPGAAWRAEAPVGHPADGARRNLRPGDSLRFGRLGLRVEEARLDTLVGASPTALLALRTGAETMAWSVPAGGALRWRGYRIAVLAVHGAGELGAGLVELEVARLRSLPGAVARAVGAGGAELRLRVPHRITRITLHHSGSAEPLRPEDDPVEKLRGLQRWGRTDRNWWDVPYHFLIDLEGRIYEGRDWRYAGETNTSYDPGGHLLISVIGNYDLQEPTAAQLDAIADLMAWAVAAFDVPVDRIGGHYDHASTSCPGVHLRRYLEDGTFGRAVEERLREDA